MSKEQLDDAKKKTNLNVDLVGATATLPDISATTPKVSLFEFQSAGQELINACVQQTEKFSGIAATKAGFMKMNQERADSTIKFTPCVVVNATGVRLSLKSSSPVEGNNYPAPDTIEPGECASFLVTSPYKVTYEVQVFEGPFPFPPAGGGWQAPTGDQVIPQFVLNAIGFAAPDGIPVTPSTAKGAVQDMGGGGFVSCTFTWSANLNPGVGDQSVPRRFTIRQSIP